MRTSAHVLALVCLAVGIAPLFTHASATHSDTEQMRPAKSVESITQAMAEQKKTFTSHFKNLRAESGRWTTMTPELREQFRTHHKVMSGLEDDVKLIQEKDPSVPEATLADLRKELRKQSEAVKLYLARRPPSSPPPYM
ncbi:hypothetical protein F5148DRAFT_1231406, partial [Russula earlei]